MSVLTPARRNGVEFLDLAVTPGLRRRSHRDIALANVLFGGISAVWRALRPHLAHAKQLSLLDVGTGIADIPTRLVHRARRFGVELVCYGLDTHGELIAGRTTSRAVTGIAGDARVLPLRDASVDVVFCSQLLHHFAGDDTLTVLREMHRVARRLVIVADLRRSWLAALGIWAVSFPLGFHAVSRHDGPLSVLRGFTADELARLVRQATGCSPFVRRCYAWRIVASWCPPEVA